jgi:hypothetical protein
MVAERRGDANRPSLWAEQLPLAVVGGQGPHPLSLNYPPGSRVFEGGQTQSGRNHVVEQRKSAPGPFRRGCGDETWSAVTNMYGETRRADS